MPPWHSTSCRCLLSCLLCCATMAIWHGSHGPHRPKTGLFNIKVHLYGPPAFWTMPIPTHYPKDEWEKCKASLTIRSKIHVIICNVKDWGSPDLTLRLTIKHHQRQITCFYTLWAPIQTGNMEWEEIKLPPPMHHCLDLKWSRALFALGEMHVKPISTLPFLKGVNNVFKHYSCINHDRPTSYNTCDSATGTCTHITAVTTWW